MVGAGIGGLTTALSLHHAGQGTVTILERVRELKPLGVGINLLPHAVRELTELGLGEELAALGVPTAELVYFDRFGSRIWSEPRGRDAGYHWPQYSVHRGEFQMMLLDAVRGRLGDDVVRCGSPVTSVATEGERAVVRWTDHEGDHVIEADVVVAADVIHSIVRAQWHPDEGAPEWNGALMWRGTSWTEPFLTGRSMIMAGFRDVKFVAYPISAPTDGRQLINWIAERRVTPHEFVREDWNRQVPVSTFAHHFSDWSFDWLDVPQLIDSAESVFEYPMVDRPPLQTWTRGRVTLLGDAAHPTYPIGSNGSSQAILDARVLTFQLATAPSPDEALARYEQLRLPPTRALQEANRAMGPEIVMQLAHERAPDGFAAVSDVFAEGELAGIAAEYKAIAGFSPDELNRRASWNPQ